MEADFDVDLAHRFFSADCFNLAWSWIDRPERTPGDVEQMIALAWASFWHWSQRLDCTAHNRSIGLWQLARVYTEAGRVDEAFRYAQLCLQASQSEEVEPVYLGYAYEALARADRLAGNWPQSREHLRQAGETAANVQDLEDRQQLLADLAGFPPLPPE